MKCCPHGRRKELYLFTVAPLSSLWPPPPTLPKLNVLFILTVSVWGGGEGGGWIVLCRPYSAGILHSVSDQMQNLPNYFTTPNKMTSENDIKGLVSLKFLRPCCVHTGPIGYKGGWRGFESEEGMGGYTDKKDNKIFLIFKEIWKRALQSHIWLMASSYMTKYLRISSYSRKPFLIYDFATAPI